MSIHQAYPEKKFEFDFDEEIWYLSAAPKTNTLNVELSGITHPDPRYHVKRNAGWNMYIIEYVVRGEGSIDCEGCHYDLREGDAYILRRYTAHEYTAKPENPYEKVWINVSGALVEHILEAYNLTAPVIVRHVNLLAFFMEMKTRLQQACREVEIAQLVAQILLAFAYGDHQGEPQTVRNLTLAEKIKNCIDGNMLNSSFTAEQAAHSFGITATHARRVFRGQFGITVHQYITEQKLLTAKRLLLSSGYSVGEISDLLGYCDDNYFSAVFKKRFGLSPKRYRLKNAEHTACNTEEKLCVQ